MEGEACDSHLVRLGFLGFLFLSSLCIVGCPQPIPRVSIPGSDASPPTMVWQTYNTKTQEQGQIVEDGQSLDVSSGEPYVVTLAVEDLNSGVKAVTLNGTVQYVCERGGQVEDKKFPLEAQQTHTTPDHENKVPIRASLVSVVEYGKSGCKEQWRFEGGHLSLVGEAHNFAGGAQKRTLQVNLKKQP